MSTEPRTLRALFEAGPFKGPPRKPAQQARYERILGAAELAMALLGRANITLANLAIGLELSTSTLCRMVIDMDYLVYLLLARHITKLLAIITEIPESDANCQASRRAAYLAATRTADGKLTPAHILLLSERNNLPEDLLATITTQYETLARAVGGEDAFLRNQTLLLLDDADLTAEIIETIIPRCVDNALAWAQDHAEWSASPERASVPPPAPPQVQTPWAWLTDAELAAASGDPPEK
jgi:hypothetical protein